MSRKVPKGIQLLWSDREKVEFLKFVLMALQGEMKQHFCTLRVQIVLKGKNLYNNVFERSVRARILQFS